MSKDGFCVSWQQHGGAVCAGLQELQQRSEFVDMTLAADGHLVRVHQIVIGLASPYLKELIRSAPSPHPVIFLNNVSHKVLCCILEYIYTGEVVVPAQELRNFVQIGKSLHVKGLEEMWMPEEGGNLLQQSSSVPENTVLSVNPQQRNIIIRINDDNADATKAEKRKSAQETPAMLAPPKKRHVIHEMVHEDYDLDEAVVDNDFDADIDGNSEQRAINTEVESNPGTLLPKLMFCKSQKGNLQAILNRFIYSCNNTYRDGKKRWECVDAKPMKCRAVLTTDGDRVFNRLNPHNHPVHDSKIMLKMKKGGVYMSLDSAAEQIMQEHSSAVAMSEVS